MTSNLLACQCQRRARMAVSGHEDPFPRPRPNGRCRLGRETCAGVRANGRDAPKPDVYADAGERAKVRTLPVNANFHRRQLTTEQRQKFREEYTREHKHYFDRRLAEALQVSASTIAADRKRIAKCKGLYS
jgi:hypothetical protein